MYRRLVERDLPFDAFFERNKGFGTLYAFNALDLLVQYFAQVVGIVANNFCKNTPAAGGVMQLYNFFNGFELLNGFVVLGTFFQVDA